MSDLLKHECGIALVRLLKPLEYYQEKYGTPIYGFNKLFMLMEKQHNRGQDGSGIGCVKLNMAAGKRYMFRERSTAVDSLRQIFKSRLDAYQDLVREGGIDSNDARTVKEHWNFGGEVFLGHLRYGTSGSYSSDECHPYVRRSNWPTRNLMLAGNFTMTNLGKLNAQLVGRGQHPIFDTDTQAILEAIGYQLDEEHSQIYRKMRDEGVPGDEIPKIISKKLDVIEILEKAAADWDGGYTIGGLIGNGDMFVMRDPAAIRPGFYYKDEEVIAVASERPALMTAFNLKEDAVKEITPGCAIVVKNNGYFEEAPYKKAMERKGCSFERIYFSRGSDPEIYRERKAMGAALARPILKAIDGDLNKAIFGYIPNTAEVAFYGLMDELRRLRREEVKETILKAQAKGELTEALLDDLITRNWPRQEKIAIKDHKLRTFISQEQNRLHLASHVYDVTYGVVQSEDTLVCVDDSIVRGTTLKQSILKILSQTNPKRIVIASTAPQIRYPDCYGIDMSEMGKFVAFQATIQLLNERGQEGLIEEVYQQCCLQAEETPERMANYVKRLYDPFTAEEISKKIAEIVFPERADWGGELDIIFMGTQSLHECLIHPCGDWYFTGKYPTPGGYAILNQAFMNYYEKRAGRSIGVLA